MKLKQDLTFACLLALLVGEATHTKVPGTVSAATGHGDIRHVDLVFSSHLDVGFDGVRPQVGLDDAVINKYFKEFFPRAAATAAAMAGTNASYTYLTHSWLVRLFLDCPPRLGVACPSPAEVTAFRAAVEAGAITWHALPHNGEAELYDDDLLEFAVRSTHALDQARGRAASFGQRDKITVSQRDVPGLTRAAVPLLVRQGVRALSVGVNGGSAPPAVPRSAPFLWRDASSGTQLLAFWHPGGYSGEPVDGADECVTAPGFDRALCCAWRGDNAGPHSPQEVLDITARVRATFPGAHVAASGFDAFVRPLLAAVERRAVELPVVTAEIGKLSEYRALLRLRREQHERFDEPSFQRFSTLLLKASCWKLNIIPEHTWGVDIKDALADYDNWSNHDFQACWGNVNFSTTVYSWVRQRAYIQWAVEELGSSAAGLEARRAMDHLQALKRPPAATRCTSSSRGNGGSDSGSGGGGADGCKQGAWLLSSGAMGLTPSHRHFNRSDLSNPLVFESHAWRLELCNTSGALVDLQRRAGAMARGGDGGSAASSARWAAPGWPLAQIVYSTYSEDDYSVIWERYAYHRDPDGGLPLWFYRDFGKPGATARGGARRADLLPALEAVYWRASPAGGLHVVAQARFDPVAARDAGAPARVYLELRSPPGTQDLLLDVGWERKTPTRLPEALWVRWRPPVAASADAASGGGDGRQLTAAAGGVDPSSWLLYKLGQPISPLEVLFNGSRSLHAVGDEGVSVAAAAAAGGAGAGAGAARTADPCSGDGGGQAAARTLRPGASWAVERCGGGGGGGAAGPAPPRLRIRSLDAALASPGRPTPFPNLHEQPDLTEGISFCLVNNIWGTNYPMWSPYQPRDADMRFRFILSQEEQGDGAAAAAT